MREKYQRAVERVEQLEHQKLQIEERIATLAAERKELVAEIQQERTTAVDVQHGKGLQLMSAHHRYEIWDCTPTHADVIGATDSWPAALREYMRARRARRGHRISMLRGSE